eukprot:8458456-Karenia_brevis.AAC.1
MPHIREVVRAFDAQFRALLQPADIGALSKTEAPLFVQLRILPVLESQRPQPEQAASTSAAAGTSASSSSGS